jgi:hypothetical protein
VTPDDWTAGAERSGGSGTIGLRPRPQLQIPEHIVYLHEGGAEVGGSFLGQRMGLGAGWATAGALPTARCILYRPRLGSPADQGGITLSARAACV